MKRPPISRTSTPAGFDRRTFIKSLGGGLAVLWLIRWPEVEAAEAESGGSGTPERARDDTMVGAWLHIGADGTVTVFTGKAEVGQNIRTSLSQAVAEELLVPLTSIRLVMADTDIVPYDRGTFGSRTTPQMNLQLRRVAATAREELRRLAAAQLGVEPSALVLEDGRVTTTEEPDRALSYGELTQGRELVCEVDEAIALRPAEAWTVMGTSVAKVNGRDFVTGRHLFTSDIRRPDMWYGRILRPAAFGASLARVDVDAVESMPDAQIVRDGDFIGVVAPDSARAARALGAIRAEWTTTPQVSRTGLWEHLRRTGEGSDTRNRAIAGRVERGLAAAEHRVEQEYTVAYIAHVPLEPRAAVAEWSDDRVTVWTGTQRPFGVRSELAAALGIGEDRVRVIVPDTGSGYGGKHTGEAAVEAARLARATGRPVKVVWTREEEFAWAYVRPAGVIDVRAGCTKDGTLTAWEFHNYNSGGAAIELPYECPHRRIEFHASDSPLRQGSYRGLAATANNFAREAQIDDLAQAAGLDPVAFRLKNLVNPRLRAVVEAAAQRFGWGRNAPTRERGFGFGCGTDKGSYIATCAEVAVDAARGSVRVVRLVSAYECGAVVNPVQLRNQVEGGILMGLGGALFERVEFADGRVLNARLSQYRVPRFQDMPEIETVILDRSDLPSAGAGETPIIAIAPAIRNAIAATTGVRLYALPLVPDGLRIPARSEAS